MPRRIIAEALIDATEAALSTEVGIPSRGMRRAALRWAYSTRIRDDGKPPVELEKVVRRLDENTVPMVAFNEQGGGAALARGILNRISKTLEGKPAAANTANRKRMVLNSAMEFGQEVGVLTANPFKAVKWTKPRRLTTVDPCSVININQARRFLAEVEANSNRGRRMKAFFAACTTPPYALKRS